MTFKEAQNAYAVFEPASIIIILAFLFMIIVLTYLLSIKFFDDTKINMLKVSAIIIPISLVGLIYLANIYKTEMNKMDIKIETQYIEKLPKEKMEVINYGNVNVTDIEIKNYHFTQEESEILALKVSFNKNGIITEKIIKAQVKVVKDLKQAYLEYQILEQDLSASQEVPKFKKGYYNTTLYIPE